MNEEQYLFSLQNRGIKLGLERTIQLLECCNNPHQKIKVIQIIGTNGKGSTSAILAQLLEKKYKVGLYTSPHLYSFRERIRINGAVIPIDTVTNFLNNNKNNIERLGASFFEVMTVMAVSYFQDENVDYAIMETGLGGKFDSVSACNAHIYGITSISMDHSHILGNRLIDIANEKVGAIKNKSIVYSVSQQNDVSKVITDYCSDKKCKLNFISVNKKLKVSLKGDHQKENASLAVSIFKYIEPNIINNNINKQLLSINWFGRNQVLKNNPDIIFDVAHNEQGFLSFIKYIKQRNRNYKSAYLLLSLQKNKILINTVDMLYAMFDQIIYTMTSPDKSMEFSQIKRLFPHASYIKNPNSAIEYIINKATKDDFIGIVGTHYWGNAIKEKFNISFEKL